MNARFDCFQAPARGPAWSAGRIGAAYVGLGLAWLLLAHWWVNAAAWPRPDRVVQALWLGFVVCSGAALVALVHGAMRRQQALAERQRLHQAHLDGLFRTAIDAVVVVDAMQRVVSFNPAAEAMFGQPAAGLLGRDLAALLPPGAGDAHAAHVARFGDGGTRARRMGAAGRPVTGRRGDGSLFPVEASISHFEVGGQRFYTAILRDGTQLERDARARAEAERASLAKSDFLASMSHEIRTPLNAILGFTQVLKRQRPRADQAGALDSIEQAGRHLIGLLADVLDISRIEAGRLLLDEADFSLPELLAQVECMVAEPARAKGLRLVVAHEGVPAWLRGDPTRLRQALLNYAANAVKFSPRGTVWLRVRAQPGGGAGGRLRLRFEVQDEGPGIPAAAQARLFGAFEQADASTPRTHGGSGLGLHITRRLAGLMGGEAGVHSQPGEGALFWFTAVLAPAAGPMPAPAGALPAGSAETHLRQRHAGRRVLVADDNPVNLEVVSQMLALAGLVPVTAADGHEALAQARAGRFDLILMDMQMPGLDGLEATRRIRALPGAPRVPIVALTGNAFRRDRAACLDAGMDAFLSKPVEAEALYAQVLRQLEAAGPAR